MPKPRNKYDQKKCQKLQKRLIATFKRLQSEEHCFGLLAKVNKKNVRQWTILFDGPEDSPYEGGRFCLNFYFPMDFPFKPPTVNFKNFIFHCNVDYKGNICVDILKDRWSPVQTISSLVTSIHLLLSTPNPDDPLNDKAARLYLSNRAEHDRIAREMTFNYAMPRTKFKKYVDMNRSKKGQVEILRLDHLKKVQENLDAMVAEEETMAVCSSEISNPRATLKQKIPAEETEALIETEI